MAEVTPDIQQQHLPRVAIHFCTQCKWMLRAAYFAQELLSTFSTSLGEVALVPVTGGLFRVTITTAAAETEPQSQAQAPPAQTKTHLLWDRKTEGGFPETKELKRRVRDVIQPDRDLGHVDRHHGATGKQTEPTEAPPPTTTATATATTSTPADPTRPQQEQPEAAAPPSSFQSEDHPPKSSSSPSTAEIATNPSSSLAPPDTLVASLNLKKHPLPPGAPLANPPPEAANEAMRSRLAANARARIDAARANKGQQEPAQGQGQGQEGHAGRVDGDALKAELGKKDAIGAATGQKQQQKQQEGGGGGKEEEYCEECA